MAVQTTFKRYETKYLLTREQKEKIQRAMAPYMALDNYGRTTIRNLYYDTGDYRLVRHSIDRPAYKEKLRVRSYRAAGDEDTVFIELKKKYDSVVYKRRLTLPAGTASRWLAGEEAAVPDTQIAREVEYFRDYYKTLTPRVFLSYEREAYYARQGGDFRITFDENILARTDRLSLAEIPEGDPVIPADRTLMEVKCSGGYPLWLVQVLSRERIFKTSFSKYGTAYIQGILPDLQKNLAAESETEQMPVPLWTAQRVGGKKYA